MSTTASNVSVGKPSISGAISVAPIGTTLPTDATTALAAAFSNLGYVSQDGLVKGGTLTRENLKAWGGDTVLSEITEKTTTYRFTLIESLSADVQKFVHGDGNVSGSLASGLTVKINRIDPGEKVIAVDMLLRNNAVKRIVIPRGVISDIGEVVYKDDTVVGYACTILAIADSDGNDAYEYIKRPAAST